MAKWRRIIAILLVAVGFAGVVSIMIVDLLYYQEMPRQPEPGTGRVHAFRALRTQVFVNQEELERAHLIALFPALGFVCFAIGVTLSRKSDRGAVYHAHGGCRPRALVRHERGPC